MSGESREYPRVITSIGDWLGPDIRSGRAVRRYIPPDKDVYATCLVEHGRLGRGYVLRVIRHGAETGQSSIHAAVDILADRGVPIYAARSGVAEFSGQKGGYGEVVVLRHCDGSSTLYAHMNQRALRPLELVLGGALVGWVGSTSGFGSPPFNPEQWSTLADPRCQRFRGMMPHLHFSVLGVGGPTLPVPVSWFISGDNERRYGIDPIPWMREHGIRAVCHEVAQP